MHESFAIFNVSMWWRCDGKFGFWGVFWASKHTPGEKRSSDETVSEFQRRWGRGDVLMSSATEPQQRACMQSQSEPAGRHAVLFFFYSEEWEGFHFLCRLDQPETTTSPTTIVFVPLLHRGGISFTQDSNDHVRPAGLRRVCWHARSLVSGVHGRVRLRTQQLWHVISLGFTRRRHACLPWLRPDEEAHPIHRLCSVGKYIYRMEMTWMHFGSLQTRK